MSSVLAFEDTNAVVSEFSKPFAFSTDDGFLVSLEFFSGPMDLLLHLVHQQEVDVSQVSMRLIAEQYLEIISRARIIDLEKASEYLVIAATLLSIKSASLLPQANANEVPDVEQNSEEFYEELRARLKAYEETKARARALIELPQLGVDVFSRIDRKALLPTPEMLAEPEEVTSLALLFGRLLKRVGGALDAYRIRLESISVVSYMMKIVDAFGLDLRNGPTHSFRALLGRFASKEGTRSSEKTRGVVIGSFIAVLELVKRGLLEVKQANDDGDIALNMKFAQSGPLDSEFDTLDNMPADLRSKLVLFPSRRHDEVHVEDESQSSDDYELMKANDRGEF